MITIAIELNHVIRNVNKQLLKYYSRDYHPELDIDEIEDLKENILDKYIKFDSKKDLNEFLYVDYPYEIFGCAKTCDKNLGRDMNNWIEQMSNIEDEDVDVIYYSLNEEALTIQSSYFFLSKIGTRVRQVVFPKNIDELRPLCDVVISANPKSLEWAKNHNKKTVQIIANGQEKNEDNDYVYDSMTDLIEDKNFLNNLIKNHNN